MGIEGSTGSGHWSWPYTTDLAAKKVLAHRRNQTRSFKKCLVRNRTDSGGQKLRVRSRYETMQHEMSLAGMLQNFLGGSSSKIHEISRRDVKQLYLLSGSTEVGIHRMSQVCPHFLQRRGESQWTTAGEDSSFDDDDEISLDAEELEKVMSAKGY